MKAPFLGKSSTPSSDTGTSWKPAGMSTGVRQIPARGLQVLRETLRHFLHASFFEHSFQGSKGSLARTLRTLSTWAPLALSVLARGS